MNKNTFFLRDGYTLEEKQDRILARDFSPDSALVIEILDDTRIPVDEFRDMSKEGFLNNLQEEVSDNRYREFIEEMFQKYGQKGDKFNQQLFNTPPLSDISNLQQKLEYFEGESLAPTFDDILTQPVFLNEVEVTEDHISLRFNTASRTEEYESDSEVPITILDEEGELVEEIPEGNRVSIPDRTRVEARIYKSAKYVSISNSDVPSRLQGEVFNIINRTITSELEELIYD